MPEAIATADDQTYDPSVEPESSGAWLALIDDATKKFRDWQDKADKIERLYASLERRSSQVPAYGDREYAIFWANIEVLKPSIYARPPVPVVVPKFKDRRPIPRTASEFLERATVTAFDRADIDSIMKLVRDDLAIVGRGVAWVRYVTKADSKTDYEKLCIDFLDREDFLHDPARNWTEVGWVARRAWMTHKEMEKRFGKDKADKAEYLIDKKDRPRAGVSPRQKAPVWEIWSKSENRVVWVTEGVTELLESDEPHLKLEGFFPCPKPAYATVEPRSLLPVPDVMKYDDQLVEIDKLTNRIHALADAVKAKGFYQAGGEIGDAIEKALTLVDDRQTMIPISSMGTFGQNGDPVYMWPIEQIATTIQGLIEMRRQIIDDVYQISGISDVQRGETDPNETLGAQQLKQQNGSVRVREKQSELVRVARDLVRIVAEIMAENFEPETLLEMSQMEIPTKADIREQIAEIEKQARAELEQVGQQAQQAMQNPEMAEQAKQNPQAAEQQLQQAQQAVIQKYQPQLDKIAETVTLEDVMDLLRDQKIRPFVLDIETDSTIQPDEQMEKQARTEFVQALGGTLQQFLPVAQMMPQAAPLIGDIIKFALAPFRAGRELEGKIDEAVEAMAAQASQPQPNPEAEKLKAEQAMEQMRMQMEQQKQQAEDARAERELQMKAQIEEAKLVAEREGQMLDAQIRQRESEQKMALEQQKGEREERKFQMEIQKLQMEIEAQQAQLAIKAQTAQMDAEIKAQQAQQQAVQSERAFAQKSALTAQQAAQSGREG